MESGNCGGRVNDEVVLEEGVWENDVGLKSLAVRTVRPKLEECKVALPVTEPLFREHFFHPAEEIPSARTDIIPFAIVTSSVAVALLLAVSSSSTNMAHEQYLASSTSSCAITLLPTPLLSTQISSNLRSGSLPRSQRHENTIPCFISRCHTSFFYLSTRVWKLPASRRSGLMSPHGSYSAS